MKKLLLLLLIFSASFASAQQIITIVELTSPDGRGTFAGPQAIHAVQGDDISRFQYGDYTTSVSSFTMSNAGELTIPQGVFTSAGNFRQDYIDFWISLGANGRFYNPNTELELENIRLSSYLIENTYGELTNPNTGWVRGEGDLASGFSRVECIYTFVTVEVPGRGFTLTGVSSGAPITLNYPADVRGPAGPRSSSSVIFSASRDFPGLVARGHYFPTAQHVIDAVNIFLENNDCSSCTNTVAEGGVMNALITAAEPNYEAQGNGVWIDRDTRPNGFLAATWNSIEIDEENRMFILEVDAAGDGAVGIRTSYECLEELLDNLPQ